MKTKIICLLMTVLPLTLPAEDYAPVGGSVEQIVMYYNQRANAVKAADNIAIDKHDLRKIDMKIPGIFRALAPKGMLEKFTSHDTTITETFINGISTNGTMLSDFIPVNGKSYVSQLRVSHVQSASCTEQDGGWIVTINLKDEPLDAISNSAGNTEDMSEADRERLMDDLLSQSGYGSSMDLGTSDFQNMERPDSQQRPAASGSPSTQRDGGFQDGVIVAVLNQAGQLTSLSLSYNMSIRMRLLGMNIRIESASKQEYQFIW